MDEKVEMEVEPHLVSHGSRSTVIEDPSPSHSSMTAEG